MAAIFLSANFMPMVLALEIDGQEGYSID